MRKFKVLIMFMTVLLSQQVFAADSSADKSCSTIADACLAAGFVKAESAGKGIWTDCMKPVILGKTVTGVKVDPSDVKSCRVNKIKEFKAELKEFQKAN